MYVQLQPYADLSFGGFNEHVHAWVLHCTKCDIEEILRRFASN